MRLFSMYFLCKEYTECVEEMILEISLNDYFYNLV